MSERQPPPLDAHKWATQLGRSLGARRVAVVRLIERDEVALHCWWAADGNWRHCLQWAELAVTRLRRQRTVKPSVIDLGTTAEPGWCGGTAIRVGDDEGFLLLQGTELCPKDLIRVVSLAAHYWEVLDQSERLQSHLLRWQNGFQHLRYLVEAIHLLVTRNNRHTMLQTIARTAREMLNVEIVHLMIASTDERTVRVEYTEGAERAQYLGVQLPLDRGIVGLAFRNGNIVTSARLLQDPRRNESYDDLLELESVASGMCAPMYADGRLMGMLYACTRRPRWFSEDEVLLMGDLAAIGAAALQHARLVDELSRAQHVAAEKERMLALVLEHQQQLLQLVLNERGIDDIVRTLATILDCPVLLEGPHFQMVACASPGGLALDWNATALGPRRHHADIREALRQISESRRSVQLPRRGSSGGVQLVVPVQLGSEIVGYLSAIKNDGVLTQFEVMMAEQGAVILSLDAAKARAVTATEERLGVEVVTRLLQGGGSGDASVVYRATRLGYRLDNLQVVVVLEVAWISRGGPKGVPHAGVNRDQAIIEAVREAAGERHLQTLAASWHGRVVVLIQPPRGAATGDQAWLDAWFSAVLRRFRDKQPGLGLRGGASTIHASADNIPEAYREASIAADVANRIRLSNRLVAYDQLGVMALIGQTRNPDDVDTFVQNTLGSLLAYDAQHRADLLLTLYAYLSSNRRHNETSERLRIHPNTLKYRLKRIEEVGNLSLDDAEQMLNVHMALKVLLLVGHPLVLPSGATTGEDGISSA